MLIVVEELIFNKATLENSPGNLQADLSAKAPPDGAKAEDKGVVPMKAESTGVEPVSPFGHWFSKPAHYRSARSPLQSGFETDGTSNVPGAFDVPPYRSANPPSVDVVPSRDEVDHI